MSINSTQRKRVKYENKNCIYLFPFVQMLFSWRLKLSSVWDGVMMNQMKMGICWYLFPLRMNTCLIFWIIVFLDKIKRASALFLFFIFGGSRMGGATRVFLCKCCTKISAPFCVKFCTKALSQNSDFLCNLPIAICFLVW